MEPRRNAIKILLACEESGACRHEFRSRGFDAWSCDIRPASDGGEHHIQRDVFEVLGWGWDAMIAFWPCTRLCNSGVRWLHERDLWDEMEDSARKFRRLLDYGGIRFRAMENPIPHKYAIGIIGAKYDQIIQPWQFGHGETKATCLWLRGLPPLQPTCIVAGRDARIHRMPPGENRGVMRSKTYPGIAKAMADQWGDHLLANIESRTDPKRG